MFRNPLTDVIVVLVVVLLIFGPKRLPQLGRGLGQGMREFKDGITGGSKDSDEEQPALEPGSQSQAAEPAPNPTPESASAGAAEAREPAASERGS